MAGTAIRLPQVGHALTGDHAFRQTQTAFAVREFAEHGVNLLASPLPVFGSAQSVPLEFPLVQAFARTLMFLGLTDSEAARTAGLIGFQLAALLWWVLMKRWHGAGLAFMSLGLAELLPFGLHWGAAALIDFPSVALALSLVLAFDVWLLRDDRGRWAALAVSTVCAWLLFLVKVTTVPLAGLLLLTSVSLALLQRDRESVLRRAVAGLTIAPGTALVAVVIWTRFADSVKHEHAATRFLESRNLMGWNFGGSRTDLSNWSVIADRVSGSIAGFGSLALVLGICLGLLGSRRDRLLTAGLVLGSLASVCIFFNLYVVHSYYLISIYFPLLTLVAFGAIRLSKVASERPAALLAIAVVAGAVMTSSLSVWGKHDRDAFSNGYAEPYLARALAELTRPGDRVLLVGCDWDPEYLYLSHRTGLMFPVGIDSATVRAIWKENSVTDYAFVARCDADISIARYLPPGTGWSYTRNKGVFTLDPTDAR